MFLLLPHWAHLLVCIESLHLQRHLVMAGVLRTAIKETDCTFIWELIPSGHFILSHELWLSYVLTYLITDWLTLTYYMEQHTSWEVIFPQLVKKFPNFYRTSRFVAAFTRVFHFFLSWARWIQSTQLSCFHKSSFNVIHTSKLRFSKWSLQVSSPKFCMQVCYLCVPHALPLSFSLIWSP